MSSARYGIGYTLLRGMRLAKPLDLLPYNKQAAMRTLAQEFNWQYYGAKHFESRWTRYFQGWWLPMRFGYDKRLAHLSSLILSGQMSRDEALAELQSTAYTEEMMREDLDLILRKLNLSVDEWTQIMALPLHAHDEYPTSSLYTRVLMAGRDLLRRTGLLR
jgi:hypothetical protein